MRVLGAIACLAMMMGGAGPAWADCQWTGAGPDHLWSTAANWTGCSDAVPLTGTVTLPAGVGQPLIQNDIASGLDLDAIVVAAGPHFQISGLAFSVDHITVNTNADLTLMAPIAGTGDLIKAGAGSLVFTGVNPNSYTGTTTVQAGLLVLSKSTADRAVLGPIVIGSGGELATFLDNQIADQAPVTIDTGGKLHIAPPNNNCVAPGQETIGSLAGDGLVLIDTCTNFSIGANNASTTFTGTLTSPQLPIGFPNPPYNRVIKIGTGTLTLTGGNSDIGDLAVVSAGTLLLDGVLGGRGVTVKNNATLGGTGTLGNNNSVSIVTVTDGAIGPGDANRTGILHVQNQLNTSGSLVVQLNGPTPGAGYDRIALASNTFAPSVQLGSNTQLVVSRGFSPSIGTTFTIIDLPPGQPVGGTFVGLGEGATLDVAGQHFSITYHGGDGNDVVLTAIDDAPPSVTYYLSEGATGGFFDEDILIANPNGDVAPVLLTFSKESGEQVIETRSVPPQSRLTVHVDAIPGLEATAASAQITSVSGAPLMVERSMFWDKSYYAGSTGSAVDRAGPDWFFAEGSQGFFSTFVLVINPNPTPTEVTFTFFRERESAVIKTITVAPTSRLTLFAGDVPELVNRSFGIAVHATQPIMAERSMYFGNTPTRLWSGGHESAGVSAAATNWFFAEGATSNFFTTYILLSNPTSTDALVTLNYLVQNGSGLATIKLVPANTRLTVNIATEQTESGFLDHHAMSTNVISTVPIIAERSMYWLGAAMPWGEGHNSFGVTGTGTKWGLAEGRKGGPLNFHTYILIANVGEIPANVSVTFLREAAGAAPIVKTYTVPATTRFNVDSSDVPELADESFGAIVQSTNGVPIVVERSMYWDSNGFQFSGGTNASGMRLP